MQGTRRTIVTAAASFAVVLGVGSVAAATSAHGSRSGSTPGTSVATVRAHPQVASSSMETDEDTTATIEKTIEKKSSTAVRVHTPDTVEKHLGDVEGDDQGEATEEAHENENAEVDEHDEKTSTTIADGSRTEADGDHGDNHPGTDGSDSRSGTDLTEHGGND